MLIGQREGDERPTCAIEKLDKPYLFLLWDTFADELLVCWCLGKAEDSSQAKAKPNIQVQTKDDAYDTFMKEMAGLL